MILSLRQCHRRMFLVIGILLPVAFAVGIMARKPVPRMTALPGGLNVPLPLSAELVWERRDLFEKVPVGVRLARVTATTGANEVSFFAPADFVKPDLMVYWVAGPSSRPDGLPENARLLGAFDSAVLPLPAEVMAETGAIILFSLADQEVVDVSKTIWWSDSAR